MPDDVLDLPATLSASAALRARFAEASSQIQGKA